MALESKSRRWELIHSLWMIWALVPTLAWVAFLWIGIKGKKQLWLILAAIYFVVFFLAPWVVTAINNGKQGTGNEIVGLLFILGWVVGIIHVLLVRNDYLLRLEALQPIKREAQEAEVATIREDYGDPQAEARARALFEQCNDLVMEIEGDFTTEARSKPSALRTEYADALAKRAEGEQLLDAAKRPHEFHAAEAPLQQCLQMLQQVQRALATSSS